MPCGDRFVHLEITGHHRRTQPTRNEAVDLVQTFASRMTPIIILRIWLKPVIPRCIRSALFFVCSQYPCAAR